MPPVVLFCWELYMDLPFHCYGFWSWACQIMTQLLSHLNFLTLAMLTDLKKNANSLLHADVVMLAMCISTTDSVILLYKECHCCRSNALITDTELNKMCIHWTIKMLHAQHIFNENVITELGRGVSFVLQMARDPWPGATAESYGLTPN